jgi:hypothetical protein
MSPVQAHYSDAKDVNVQVLNPLHQLASVIALPRLGKLLCKINADVAAMKLCSIQVAVGALCCCLVIVFAKPKALGPPGFTISDEPVAEAAGGDGVASACKECLLAVVAVDIQKSAKALKGMHAPAAAAMHLLLAETHAPSLQTSAFYCCCCTLNSKNSCILLQQLRLLLT